MPEDDGSNLLALNLYLVSDTLADPNVPVFTDELQRIFAQVDVEVAITGVERLAGTSTPSSSIRARRSTSDSCRSTPGTG